MKILCEDENFYIKNTLSVSKALIGKKLIRTINGEKLIMEITETEAYMGIEDKASHAFNGKKTNRTKVMYEKGGTIYIYLIYGMYLCLNFVTEAEGKPCAVLIRGGKPIYGLDTMSFFRFGKKYSELSSYQKKNFANGPGKLCQALGITKELNGKSLFSDELYVSSEKIPEDIKIKSGTRINIDYAEEYKYKLWRFFKE